MIESSLIDIKSEIVELKLYIKSVDSQENNKTVVILNKKLKVLLEITKEKEEILEEFGLLEKEEKKMEVIKSIEEEFNNDIEEEIISDNQMKTREKNIDMKDSSVIESFEKVKLKDENENSFDDSKGINKIKISNQLAEGQTFEYIDIQDLKTKIVTNLLESKGLMTHTIINNNLIVYINNKTKSLKVLKEYNRVNDETISDEIINSIEMLLINKLIRIMNDSDISKNYHSEINSCDNSCGVAIKKWNKAKEYCSIQGTDLASQFKRDKEQCLNCQYWTNSEATRPNGKSYPIKKAYVYSPSENDFFKFSEKGTHIANCK